MSYKYILPLFFLVTYGQFSFCQYADCDNSKITRSDKVLLSQFWGEFTKAVNTGDKQALSTLIKFPFNCDYCSMDKGQKENDLYLKITKSLFNQGQYKIFFDPKLKKRINQKNILDILVVTSQNKRCSYNFGYRSIEPLGASEGQGHFFSLEKQGNKFVITSAWTMP